VTLKPTHRLNALNTAKLLLSVRSGCGILMDGFTEAAGSMEKDGMLKEHKEMSYLEDVKEPEQVEQVEQAEQAEQPEALRESVMVENKTR